MKRTKTTNSEDDNANNNKTSRFLTKARKRVTNHFGLLQYNVTNRSN